MACEMLVELCGGAVSVGTIDVRVHLHRCGSSLYGPHGWTTLGTLCLPRDGKHPGPFGLQRARLWPTDFLVTVPSSAATSSAEVDLTRRIGRIHGVAICRRPAASAGRTGLLSQSRRPFGFGTTGGGRPHRGDPRIRSAMRSGVTVCACSLRIHDDRSASAILLSGDQVLNADHAFAGVSSRPRGERSDQRGDHPASRDGEDLPRSKAELPDEKKRAGLSRRIVGGADVVGRRSTHDFSWPKPRRASLLPVWLGMDLPARSSTSYILGKWRPVCDAKGQTIGLGG